MTEQEIEGLVSAQITASHLHVEGDGYHFVLTIVSDDFDNLPSVKRQQTIYALLNKEITSGDIHALSIKAYTPDEWQALQEQQNG